MFSIVWGNWATGVGSLAQSMAAPAVAGLFLLCLANAELRRRRPQWVLNRGELIALYALLALSTGSVRHAVGLGRLAEQHHHLAHLERHAGQPLGGDDLAQPPELAGGVGPRGAARLLPGGQQPLPLGDSEAPG